MFYLKTSPFAALHFLINLVVQVIFHLNYIKPT